MTKASRKSSRTVTVVPPSFIGMPLYSRHRDKEELAEAMRAMGEALTSVANKKSISRFNTPDGWVYSSEADRKMLIRWLSKLPKLPPRMLKEIAEYAGQLRPDSTKIHSSIEKGAIALFSITSCSPPAANVAFGYAMAALLSYDCGENFGCCPECGTWFFDIPFGRPMKKYCSPEHSNKYRQRKYQEKRK